MSSCRFLTLRLVLSLYRKGIHHQQTRSIRTFISLKYDALRLQVARVGSKRVTLCCVFSSFFGGSILSFNNAKLLHCVSTESCAPEGPTGIATNEGFSRVFVTLRLIYLTLLFIPVLFCHIIEFLLPLKVISSLKWRLLLYSIQRAGPAFIKLGQWASTRPDIFSETTCVALSELQRDCTPHSWESTRQTLEESFGSDWEDMFTQHNHTPIGSGCIAQVYKWSLRKQCLNDDNRVMNTDLESLPVAVKVLHPGVADSVLRDVHIMETVAYVIDKLYPSVYWISLRECVDEFGIVMKKQLDLKAEARSMDQFRRNFNSHKFVKIPQPLYPLVTQTVLVETYEEGLHISHYINEVEQNSLKEQISSLGIDVLLNMLFVHNFVHCDMHPGNLLVQEPSVVGGNPSLVILDCGVTASLSKEDWNNLHQLFLAIVKREGQVVADLMLANARFNDCTDIDTYRKEMEQLVSSATEQLDLSKVKVGPLLSNLCKLLIKHKVKLESNFASVMLAVMVLEGLGRSLDPHLDILAAATPFLLRKIVRNTIT